ncbi:hypothetical protein K469DRAFT_741159 [Zopfia rhizophila CBS 207.26]|uniref:Ribosomal RNA-processing protein 8 n=1 Tax=Zopfia rhizophila CBS 207.26 TaxID=1314779 RepID=A0A6A6DNT9_9PEZI|nr:hypothetical protein K469DRAFT_741159 [Zopfia rhizophila CBS 207.26]
MFAVPGWNVSAPLKTQTATSNAAAQNSEGKKSEKRKRDKNKGLQVNESNVGEVWEKVIERRGVKAESQLEQEDVRFTMEAESKKREKKRKRSGDKGQKEISNADATGEFNGFNGQEDQAESTKGSIAEQTTTDGTCKRDKKKRKKDKQHNESNTEDAPKASNTSEHLKTTLTSSTAASLLPGPSNLTPFQESMRAKLTSARFRHLNESLYTKPSTESLSLFKENPDMFEDYHRGFAQQVQVWPENPVDGYVQTILSRGKMRTKDPWKDKKRKDKKWKVPASDLETTSGSTIKPLPRNMKGCSTIADLGCGTASLSHILHNSPSFKSLNLTIHSFDLSKPSGPSAPLVTVADISSLPLPDASADVAIFCLALMGTNWLDFVDEAWRILRWRGELWIAEIKSRFGRVSNARKPPINSVGSLRKDKKAKGKKKRKEPEEGGTQGSEDEAELAERVDGVEGRERTEVSTFVDVLRKRGFVLDAPDGNANAAIDMSNKMFVKMQFIKVVAPTRGKNVKREEAERGKGGLNMGIKGNKFTAVAEEDEAEGDEADGKVLKPCLYKTR